MSLYRYDLVLNYCKNILEDKEAIIRQEFHNQLSKMLECFKWSNLPETITIKDLEILLLLTGHATFTKVGDKYYVFKSSLGGTPNPYYLPTLSIVANPALEFNEELVIDKDCVVILNDPLYNSLVPMFNKYSSLIAEIIISLRWAVINARVPYLISADDDNTADDGKTFMRNIVEGKEIGFIGYNTFFEGVKTHEYSSKSTHIRELLEAYQYIKASWFNDIGLQSNFNMKREALNSSETGLNEDILIPLIDQMLEQRKLACEKINAMYGLKIDVELSDAWKNLRKELNNNIEMQEAEIDKTEAEAKAEVETKTETPEETPAEITEEVKGDENV